MPRATSGTPVILAFSAAATIRSPYDASQSAIATVASVFHGTNANGKATT